MVRVPPPSSAGTDGGSDRLLWKGKKKFIYGKTKAEVNQKFREFKKMLDSGTYREIQKQTVEEYVLNWLTIYKRIELSSPNPTIRWRVPFSIRSSRISRECSFLLSPMTISKDSSTNWTVMGTPIPRSKGLSGAECLFQVCYGQDQIAKNPCFEIRLPKKAEKGIKTIDVLTKDQMRKHTVPPPRQRMVTRETGLPTGLWISLDSFHRTAAGRGVRTAMGRC